MKQTAVPKKKRLCMLLQTFLLFFYNMFLSRFFSHQVPFSRNLCLYRLSSHKVFLSPGSLTRFPFQGISVYIGYIISQGFSLTRFLKFFSQGFSLTKGFYSFFPVFSPGFSQGFSKEHHGEKIYIYIYKERERE